MPSNDGIFVTQILINPGAKPVNLSRYQSTGFG
jgi:hypothetical protein